VLMSDRTSGAQRARRDGRAEISNICGSDRGYLRGTPIFALNESEPWSDPSKFVCPVIGVFMRAWNEGLPKAERGILFPLFAKIVHTSASARIQEQRALMAADWLVRTYAPAWLNLAGLREQARLLYDLPQVSEIAQAFEMRTVLVKVSHDANAEALGVDAAGWVKASDDCWASAWAAAYEAARFAAHDLAWVSAASASRAAAGIAAQTKTRSLVTALQVSAAEFVLKMARLSDPLMRAVPTGGAAHHRQRQPTW
jgi:hypothetical protein